MFLEIILLNQSSEVIQIYADIFSATSSVEKNKIRILKKVHQPQALNQACQTYGTRAGPGPLDDLIRSGITLWVGYV